MASKSSKFRANIEDIGPPLVYNNNDNNNNNNNLYNLFMLYYNLIQNTKTSCTLQPRLFDLRASCQIRFKKFSTPFLIFITWLRWLDDRLGQKPGLVHSCGLVSSRVDSLLFV